MARGPNNTSRSGGGNRPLYAIDFTAVACGKRIANTKRRVRWRFGFANPDALAAGETGTACRGEEHDVTMVWSVTSGKRLILADGQEVHYSNSRSAVIDFSWTMRGNHVLKVVAHATAPMSAEPGFRQYDFFVDGRSFFSFPKVYRLGLTAAKTMSPDQRSRSGMAESSERRKATTQGSGVAIAQIEAPHNPDEEDAYLREAIKASIESEAQRVQKGGSSPEKPKMSSEAKDMLIDFMDDFDSGGNTLPAASAPAAAAGGNQWALAPAPAQPANQWAMAPAPAADNWAVAAAAQPPAPVAQPAPAPTYDQYGGPNAYAAAPSNSFAPAPVQAAQPVQPVQNFAAPAPPASDPFANPAFAQPPPPPPMAAASPMMSPAYGQPAPAPAAADPFAPQPPAAAPGSPTHQAPAPTTNGSANAVLTMNSLTSDGLLSGAPVQPTAAAASGTMADKALQNLMGSIDSFGLSGALAKPPAANNPFDSNNIMSNATLGEIKSAKVTDRKQPVMNSAPTPAQGAIVMAGNQGGNWGGFGGQQNATQYGGMAGSMQQQAAPQYSMSGGYSQQQQQQMGYGQQPPMQQQQPMMGQQPPMQQQGYGAPQYGQQPPMQQNQWGAPSY